MNSFLENIENLTEYFGVDPKTGLTDKKAKENAAKYGSNTLARTKPPSLAGRIFESLTDPMLLLLIIALFIALGVNIYSKMTTGEAEFLEIIGIFAAIFLSVLITVIIEGKSSKAFELLNKVNADITVKVLRNGNAVLLHHADIAAGDVLLLSTGDKIPADGRLLESADLFADESALTGESVPSEKNALCAITDEKTPLAERRNMLYSGTFITGGFCRMLVTDVGQSAEFGKIARELSGFEKTSTPLQERLGRLGKLLTIFGVIAASIVFIMQIIQFTIRNELILNNIIHAFITSIVLIVAAVPEGLPTIVAISLSLNIMKLSKQHTLVKKIIACETIGCINVICSDKTGTLTENKMKVNGEITEPVVLSNICINSTAEIGEEGSFISNPTECALLVAAEKSNWNYREIRRDTDIVHSFPFSSDKKNMTTIVRGYNIFTAYSKGSPEKILNLCDIDENMRSNIEEQIRERQEKACRIIAFAHRDFTECPELNEETTETGMVFDGFAAISDPLRADVYDAVNQCRQAGVDIKILTGDNIVTASSIANELGVLGNGKTACEAREIETLSDDELSLKLEKIAVIARSTPSIKMRVVNLLKKNGNVVAVTGDGINDAPALKNADLGIAMGVSGTDVSKEASDIVLLDDSFSTIVKAVKWGRGIYENFKRFIVFQLTVNVSAVITVLASVIIGFKVPFTAIQLLWINIIMDGPPALTLGLEPIHDDLMKRQPVKRNEDILTRPMLVKTGLTGLYISAIFLLQYIFNFLKAGESQTGTVLFTMFTLFQLFNAFNCRQLQNDSIIRNFTKNKIFLLVISCTFIMQILIIQFGGVLFGTVPLELSMWLKILAVSFSLIAVSELVKFALNYFKIRR